MKRLLICVCVAVTAIACGTLVRCQSNDIGIFGFGNFNPVSYITIQNTPHVAVSSNESWIGAAAEYRHFFDAHTGLSVIYAQNSSTGNLYWQGMSYIWPLMRYKVETLAVERFDMRKKWSPFMQEGPGAIVTNGYATSGWSAGFAFVLGLGVDYHISSRWSARIGDEFLTTRSGCYDDPTCKQTWGVVQDLRTGIVYGW